MKDHAEVLNFYQNGAEIGRLERGLGKIECTRTKELLDRFLGSSQVLYDIGGGVGVYSRWLAEKGHRVTLLELAPRAVEVALQSQGDISYTALVGDARELPMEDDTADGLLLMGPLYHLQKGKDRAQALAEALRVLKPGGTLFAVGISRFSSMGWALSVYGEKNRFLDDPVYQRMLQEEIGKGEHHRPAEYPFFLAEAYFHTPQELAAELLTAGFESPELYAVEGLLWMAPNLDALWEDGESRESLLKTVRMTEQEPSILGASPHMMAMAGKPLCVSFSATENKSCL